MFRVSAPLTHLLVQLSDKYDRDRLGLTASARTKERDTTNPTKASAQNQVSSTATRRGEPRDPSKRKPNESGDDWRRGSSSQPSHEGRAGTDVFQGVRYPGIPVKIVRRNSIPIYCYR
jgi:hypothetical protein